MISERSPVRGGEQNRVVLHLGEGRYKSIAVENRCVRLMLRGNLRRLVLGDDVVDVGAVLGWILSPVKARFQKRDVNCRQ